MRIPRSGQKQIGRERKRSLYGRIATESIFIRRYIAATDVHEHPGQPVALA
jgi:hypothetical protein